MGHVKHELSHAKGLNGKFVNFLFEISAFVQVKSNGLPRYLLELVFHTLRQGSKLEIVSAFDKFAILQAIVSFGLLVVQAQDVACLLVDVAQLVVCLCFLFDLDHALV